MIAPPVLALVLAANGPSFDCAKARAADEKLVCAEAELAKLDRELAARYEATAKAADPAALAALRKAQRAWLAERASCVRWVGDHAAVRKASLRCLDTSYRWRIEDLAAPPAPAKLPDGIAERRILRRDPRANHVVDISYPSLAAGRRGGASFDAYFARQAEARLDPPTDPKTDLAVPEEDSSAETSLAASFTVPLATARFVTVVTTGYDYEGGAHGMPFKEATTFDLERGRPLALEDVFAKGRRVADAVLPIALERLGPDARDWRGGPENARKALEHAPSWTFLADGAIVTFPPYAVAPYAAGSPEVRFTWAELKPHLKPDAPFPPR